jgi:UDP-glucuronate 4-epimerase
MDATPIIVTGVAGFIGFSVAASLLAAGRPVVAVDNINDYYDPRLKDARLARLLPVSDFTFRRFDLVDSEATRTLFAEQHAKRVIHLAAQAGVRYSLVNPQAYI